MSAARESGSSFTGYKRNLRTRWTVRAAERISAVGIALGGIGTVVSVFGVCLFLAWVVLPLFLPGTANERTISTGEWTARRPLHFSIDEYRVLGWILYEDGEVVVFRLSDGEIIERRQLVNGEELEAISVSIDGRHVALGLTRGRLQYARIEIQAQFLPDDRVPAEFADMEPGTSVRIAGGAIQRAERGQFRRLTFVATAEDPIESEAESDVVLIDHVEDERGPAALVLTSANELVLLIANRFENLFTGEVEIESSQHTIPFEPRVGPGGAKLDPVGLYLDERAVQAAVVWPDGHAIRYDLSDRDAPQVAESLRVTDDPTAEVTTVEPLLGRGTFLIGDSKGRVGAWVATKPAGAETPDGIVLARAHALRVDAAVSLLSASPRTRLVLVGDEAHKLHLFNVTTEVEMLALELGEEEQLARAIIAPKNDAILALTSRGVRHWDVDLRHPEASLGALFTPVWYEGYNQPRHVWQSTGGTKEFEPKLGLWPLIFGTLKATFYSLLFGVPIALLAAIYTSEFLTGAIRTRIKTLIELMASLPSVVLGFLAALVIAPWVQQVLPATLTLFLSIPALFVGGGFLWQLLPERIVVRFQGWRVPILCLLLPLGVVLAIWFGPVIEAIFFAGDAQGWLNGQVGSSFGGWLFLLLPVSGLAVCVVMFLWVNPWFRRRVNELSHIQTALADLGRFAFAVAAAGALSAIAAGTLTASGFDVRGEDSFVGTYIQRNALVVGFVMGFAIIPIIYTIAEDALSAVPSHLRAASLGAGATRWQTAMRIVIPVAMSGLFSAVMIGLGRAVGETMIVLMAAGNTPIMDVNLFNGFRTLSANIAVELPEAVPDSTHFRTLFLAALILFLMTFVVNTVAEVVRIRFRKRAVQL